MSFLVFHREINDESSCPLKNDEGVDRNPDERKGQKDHPKYYIFLEGGTVPGRLLWLLRDVDLELLVIGLLVFKIDVIELPLEEPIGSDVLREAVFL